MGRKNRNEKSLKSLVREEEKWRGRKSVGSYERAFGRKFPNRHLSEEVGPEFGTN